MRPGLRRFALTAHLCCSVGWLGAVVVVLALAIAALTGQDSQAVRAAYLAMDVTTKAVLVPLAFASLVTGVTQSLGTTWGLFRHYWVVFKLVLNVLATIVLLLYTQTTSHLAAVASDPTSSIADLHGLALSPLLHASAALVVLLVATVLAVYKPKGRTKYGRRRDGGQRMPSTPPGMVRA